MTQPRIDRVLQFGTALTAALMAASASAPADHPWPTLLLFVIALTSAVCGALSTRLVGATKTPTVADILTNVAGAICQFAVPTAQALNYSLPTAAVIALATVGGVLGVTTHGPLAPKAGP